MPAAPIEWDEKYRAENDSAANEPAGFVQELLPLLPQGPALDVACGAGRHALLLAARGQAVTAVDQSAVALEILERRARAAGFAVSWIRRPRVTMEAAGIYLWQADLQQITLPVNAFALILCVNYLQRSLFAPMERALKLHGVLLIETYTQEQLAFAGGPRNPEYLLEPGELRLAFPALRTLFYRELQAGKGIAGLIARKEHA